MKYHVNLLGHGYEKNLHTRLRLGLSGLNHHLFTYNLCSNKFCDQCIGKHIKELFTILQSIQKCKDHILA